MSAIKKLDSIKNVDYFFENEFLSKYSNDYKAIREIIVEFMTAHKYRYATYYYSALTSEDSKYYSYAKATKRLHQDITKLKKFVKIGVLTNKDIQNFKKHNRKLMFREVKSSISEKFSDIGYFFSRSAEEIVYGGILLGLAAGVLGGGHHIGAFISRSIKSDNCQEQIAENICQDMYWGDFQYQAIDVIKDQNGNYIQIYGIAVENVDSAPTLTKVNYLIDQELYDKINEKFSVKYSYDEDSKMGKITNNSIYSKHNLNILKQIQTITEEQTPYSYVYITNQNTTDNTNISYSYDDTMER